jgi:hypothetical protein
LELTEQGNPHRRFGRRCQRRGWANAAQYYDDDQLGALVSLIALINAFTRVNVIVRQPAGDYQPGQVKSLLAAIEQKNS